MSTKHKILITLLVLFSITNVIIMVFVPLATPMFISYSMFTILDVLLAFFLYREHGPRGPKNP